MHEFSELYGSVTSAISTNQNNVRSTQCLSNKTNIYTLSNQCSITTTAYLQNSTLIQRLMFLITICRNHLFITVEINVQKISTRSKRSSRNIVTATSSLIGHQWKNCDQFRCRFWHKQIKGDDWSQNKNFFLLKKTRTSSLNDQTIWSRKLLRMRARDSTSEVCETLRAYSIFTTLKQNYRR